MEVAVEAPGRLAVEETLSGIQVRLPGEQHLLRTVYLIVFSLIAAGGVVGGCSGGHPLGEVVVGLVVVLSVLGGLAALLWWVTSRIISRMQSGSVAAALGLLLLLLCLFSPFAFTVPSIGSGLALGLISALTYFLFIRALAGPAAVLTLDQAALTVEHRGQRTSIPLEEIDALQPARSWRNPAQIGGRSVSGLSELSRAEWAWIEAAIRDSARRRRAALEAEGHDLSRAAVPPAALEALTGREG